MLNVNERATELAKKRLRELQTELGNDNRYLKIGLEMEFMVRAKGPTSKAEIISVEELKQFEAVLKERFPEKIERLYKEWGLGWTIGDDAVEFEFPGIRIYEVTFIPQTDFIELINDVYEVKAFIGEYLQHRRDVTVEWGPLPIPVDQLPHYHELALQHGYLAPEFRGQTVCQPTGSGIQFNISVWDKDSGKNLFFDEETRGGTELFYRAVCELICLEGVESGGSILPFIGCDAAFVWTSKKWNESDGPAYARVTERKGGEENGKGTVRASPLPDGAKSYLHINLERRSNETFRVETRLNDPTQNQFVCAAATLGALVAGMNDPTLDVKAIKSQVFSLSGNWGDAISAFEKSGWRDILGKDLYEIILLRARQLSGEAQMFFSKASNASAVPISGDEANLLSASDTDSAGKKMGS